MPARHKRQGRMILLTLIAAIAIDKVFVSRELPEVSEWMSVNPMPVFLDIPADLSLTFGVVPVSVIFLLLYGASTLPHGSGGAAGERHPRPASLWRAFTALLIVPCWMLSGSLLYRLVEDLLSKQVRNAIGSFGITADIHSFLPGHEFIHLRGNMVMFVFLFPGIHFCMRRIGRSVPAGKIIDPPIRIPMPIPIIDPPIPIPIPIPIIDQPIPIPIRTTTPTPNPIPRCIRTPSNPLRQASESPIPITTSPHRTKEPCTASAPVTISPVRIHIQYPKPFNTNCE
jgi:hypothetical protein